MKNTEISAVLYDIADILEEQDDNPYRIKAYRRAARFIDRYPQNLEILLKNHFDLTTISNIGNRLAELIKNIIQDGRTSTLEKFVHHNLTPPKLFRGKKYKPHFFKIYYVMIIMERWAKRLEKIPEINKFELAGDFRRKKEIIHYVDILMVTSNARIVFEKILMFPGIKYILQKSSNKMFLELKSGLQLLLFVIQEKDFTFQLIKKTGSESHCNILEKIAVKKNINIKKMHLPSEQDIYHQLGLSYIPPELRENTGEIAKAKKYFLPKLIEQNDIKGDLHCHTHETDGSLSIEEIAEIAIMCGYQYIAITDHSKNLKITHGLDEKRLFQQIKKIDKLNEKLKGIQILKSSELDILENGELDFSNDVLKELDLTVCSVHSKFSLSKEKQTERIIRAMDNPYFHILGHATGRLLQHRLPYALDFEAILQAAYDRNCFLELNAQPARLDINDLYCRKAKEMGVKIAISSDAHTDKGFGFMVLGIQQARRGWLESSDVINTYSWKNLQKLLRKR